jgi:hypothetical protein
MEVHTGGEPRRVRQRHTTASKLGAAPPARALLFVLLSGEVHEARCLAAIQARAMEKASRNGVTFALISGANAQIVYRSTLDPILRGNCAHLPHLV